jgi:hypothetical protein
MDGASKRVTTVANDEKDSRRVQKRSAPTSCTFYYLHSQLRFADYADDLPSSALMR